MSFEIWAQADVVTVRLTLAPKDQAGNLEWTVMEAIRAGASTAQDLRDIFGLAPRLIAEILGDLWRAGRIGVNLGSDRETLLLTESGLSELTEGTRTGSVRTTSTTTTSEELAFERLSGRVLPVRSTSGRSEDRDSVVPILPDDRPLSSVSSAELAAALVQAFELDDGAGAGRSRDLRVVEAHLQPELLQVASRRRYVRVRVNASLTATGDLTIAVVDERMTLRERTLATARLQTILDGQPASAFTNYVRRLSTKARLESRGIDSILDELHRRVSAMSEAPASERQSLHDQAGSLVGQVKSYAQLLASREMEVDLVRTADEHHAALAEILNSASRQVVLAVPWIRVAGLERLRAPILDALERGVQIILLWGIGDDSEQLGQPERAWLDSVVAHVSRGAHPGRLLFSRSRPAKSHAKVAVADDRTMLVTSKNFLSGSNHSELGVHLRAIGTFVSPAVEGALRYLYDKAPEPGLAFSLMWIPGSFGQRADPDPVGPTLPRWRAELSLEAPGVYLSVWLARWAEAEAEARAALVNSSPAVELVSDLQHRGVLRAALGDARRRVLVTSDQVSDIALTREIVELARQRAAEDLPVVIRYQRTRGAAAGRLDELMEPEPDAAAIPDVSASKGMHSKIILQDDSVVLGSFNALSVDAGLRGRSSTGELGVRINSSEIADSVWESVTGDRAASNPSGPASGHAPTSSHPGDADALVDALSERSYTDLKALVAALGLSGTLDMHSRYGLPESWLLPIAATSLALDIAAGRNHDQSAELLISSAGAKGIWGVAHLARTCIGSPELRPRLSLTTALSESGADGQATLAAMTSDVDLTSEEIDALQVSDLVAVLVGDVSEATAELAPNMDVHRRVSPLVADLVEHASAYWQRFGSLPAMPPPQSSAPSQSRVDLDELWAVALDSVAGLQRYPSKSEAGEALKRYLFSNGSEMSLLLSALTSRDAQAVMDWFAELAPNPNDGEWLDDSSRAAATKKIDASRRKSFLQHRRRIREAVKQLVVQLRARDAADVSAWPADQLELLEPILSSANAVRAALAAKQGPEASIAIFELDRLLKWRESGTQRAPIRDPQDWPFVTTALRTLAGNLASSDDTLTAVCEDLVRTRTPSEAIRELTESGEFGRAHEVADALHADGVLDAVEYDETQEAIRRQLQTAQADVDQEMVRLRLRCEHAGVDPSSVHLDEVRIGARAADAAGQLLEASVRVESEVQARTEAVTEALSAARSNLAPAWASYIEALIASGELRIAELDMGSSDGIQALPRPPAFARWRWPEASLEQIADWLNPDGGPAPVGLRDEFIPSPADAAGIAVVDALRSLEAGGDETEARRRWVRAVQGLVDEISGSPQPRLSADGGGVWTEFLLPTNNYLPHLRWGGEEPVRFSVGDVRVPGTLVRLAEHTPSDGAPGPVLDVADILSLLVLQGGGPPKASDRELRFLSVVCSRLDLDDVIAPREMPAGPSEMSRRRLTWLLSILGLQASPTEVDRLRVWAAGHPGVLWSLVSAARAADPIDGIASLQGRSDFDALLVNGIETELDRDEDLLVLGVGLGTEFLQIGCTRGDLAEALAELWATSEYPLTSMNVRVSESVDRLAERGYIQVRDGQLHSDGSPGAFALARVADEDWQHALRDRVVAVDLVEERAFEYVLEQLRHEQQPTGAYVSDEANRPEAWRRTRIRLTDRSAFELGKLSRSVAGRFRGRARPRPTIDLDGLGADEWWMGSDGPPALWVDCLLYELVTNAFAAAAGCPDPGTIWVELTPERRGVSLVVRSNGQPIPPEVLDAFTNRRPVRRPDRQGRGRGLHMFRVFGERYNVQMTMESSNGEAVIACWFPTAERRSRPGVGGVDELLGVS